MLLDERSKIIGILSGSSTPGTQPTYVVTGGISSDDLTDDLVDYVSASSYVINNTAYVYGGGTNIPAPLNTTNGKCWLDASGVGLGTVAPLNGIVIATFDTDATKITRWTPTATFAVNTTVNKLIENDVRLLHTDGDITATGGQLTWTQPIRIELPTASAGPATFNEIASGTFTLLAGEIAYATLDRLANSTITIQTAALVGANLGADDVLIAYFDGTVLYLPELGTNTLSGRVSSLENKEIIYEIFESIASNTSGTLAPPAESAILLDRYENAGDCLITKTGTDGRPVDEPARDANGDIILGTLDALGNWTISAAPSSYPIALVYQVSIALKYIGNITQSQICNIYNVKTASEVSYDPTVSGMAAKTVQSAVDLLDVTRNYISAGALTAAVHTYAPDGSSVTVQSTDFIVLESGKFVKRTIPTATLPLTDQATNYIVVRVSDLTFQNISNVQLIDHVNYLPVLTVPRTGAFVHEINWDAIGNAPVGKIVDRFVKTRRFERYEGVMLAVNASRNAIITAGKVYYGLTNFTVDQADSSVDLMILCVETSPGVWTLTPTTTLNNTQYNGAAGLVTLTANRYAVNFVYRGIENPKHIYYVLGREDATLSQAVAAQPPATLPFIISSHTILTGRVIYQNGSNTPQQLQSAYDTTFICAGTVAHADTIGLTDGDAGHTQFALLDGRAGGQVLTGSSDGIGALSIRGKVGELASLQPSSATVSASLANLTLEPVGSRDNIGLFLKTKGTGAFGVNHTGTLGVYSAAILGSANGITATGLGYLSAAAGDYSTAFGHQAQAIGQYSRAFAGTKTDGQYSTGLAVGAIVTTYGHTTLGLYPTLDSAGSSSMFVATDRLLTVGCGTASSNRADAFYILKNKAAYFTGGLSVAGNAVFGADAIINKASSGTFGILQYSVNGLARWHISRTNAAETGLNAGSDLIINRFADDGSYIGGAVLFNRASGRAFFAEDIQPGGTYRAADGDTGISAYIVIDDDSRSVTHYLTFKNGLLTEYDYT